MTIIWLFIWFLNGFPAVHASGDNSWFIALLVCGAIDFLGGAQL